MNSYVNVLKFIDRNDWSTRHFETLAGLSNGTLDKVKPNKDLSVENVVKIVDRFSTELQEAGFYIIDMAPFGREGYMILSDEQKAKLLKQLPGAEIKQKNIDSKTSADYLLGRLDVKEEVIAEKELRRMDTAKQLESAHQEKDKLFQALAETRQTINGILSTVVTSLNETKAETSLALSYHRTWVEYTAETGAAGDEKKRSDILQRLNTLLEQQIPEELRVDRKAGGRRPRTG